MDRADECADIRARSRKNSSRWRRHPATTQNISRSKRSPALVGDCGLRAIDWKSRKADFFITIGEKQFWDKGFGNDALRIVTRLAFEKMNLNRLWLTVLVDNSRAVRCYEKCGFIHEGLLRQESYVDGKYRDVFMMGLIRADYDAAAGP